MNALFIALSMILRIAVLEAMAANIPVFVNDWAVMQEITDRGNTLLYTKPRMKRICCEQFLLFLQDRDQYLEKPGWQLIMSISVYILHHIEQLKENYHRTLNIQENSYSAQLFPQILHI